MIDFKKKFSSLFETPTVSKSVAIYREKTRPMVVAAGKVASTSAFALLASIKAIAMGPITHSLILPMVIATVGLLSFASPTASPNTWYIGSDGWTLFLGTPTGTGTACLNASSTTTRTCIVSVSTAGVDATCAAEPMPVGLTSATLSSFTPALPCLTMSKAQSLMRDNKPDWLVARKGDEWCGGLFSAAGGALTKNGKDAAEPQLFAAYGVGARPKFKTCGQNVTCVEATSNVRGRYVAIIGIECYSEYMDPASPDFLGVTVTATATSGNAILTGVTNVSGDYANLTTSYRAFGSGVVATAVSSINTGAATITLASNASFSGTMQFQFAKVNNTTGIGFTNAATLFIMEDVYLNYTTFSFAPSPPSESSSTNPRFRRNIITNSYSGSGIGGSPFIGDVYTGQIVVEENLSYHVGWHETVWAGAGYNQVHGWYFHDPNRGTTFMRNITALSSGNAGQIRNGGTLYDNLSINNPIGWNQTPFGFTSPGGTVSYNTVTGSGETITGMRIANAATAVGNAIIHVPGVFNSGSTTFIGRSVDNLDNPGSIVGGISSLGADTITMISNVAAGQRGNGVQIGDRIQISVYGGQGDNTRATGVLLLSTNTNNPGNPLTYPIGSSQFFAQASFPIPAWVVPGMRIQPPDYPTAFPSGFTTVATVAVDRLSLTTADVSAAAMPAFQVGANAFFPIFTPASDVSAYWPANIMTKNIYANNLSLGRAGGASFALNLSVGTQGASLTDNYIYNWNPNPTLNVLDSSSFPGQNVISPQLRSCGGTGGSTCSNDKPNLFVEAYEATLNTNNITASIGANAFGGTIITVTAGTLTVGERVFGTGVIPTLVLSDFGGGVYLVDTAQTVGSQAMYTGSLARFLAGARAQSKDNWNPAYTANAVNEFFRAQVGIASQPVTYH